MEAREGKASPSWERGCGFGVPWLLRAALAWRAGQGELGRGGENLKMFWPNGGFWGEELDLLFLENKNRFYL